MENNLASTQEKTNTSNIFENRSKKTVAVENVTVIQDNSPRLHAKTAKLKKRNNNVEI